MSYKFESRLPQFLAKNERIKDFLLGNMSMDIEVNLKTTAGMPVSATKKSGNKRGGGGHMKASTYHKRVGRGKFKVVVNKEYAGYQEFGQREDGSHIVTHYSTPGTSKGFMARAVGGVTKNKSQYVLEARRAFNL